MKLPNADKAVVEREKVEDYLLNSAHPDNGGKAQFFERFGFHRNEWKILAEAFFDLARTAEVTHSMNRRKDRNMLLLAGLNQQAENWHWCGQFGLWTKARMSLDW